MKRLEQTLIKVTEPEAITGTATTYKAAAPRCDDQACSACGGVLLYSARQRGDGLCGPCSRRGETGAEPGQAGRSAADQAQPFDSVERKPPLDAPLAPRPLKAWTEMTSEERAAAAAKGDAVPLLPPLVKHAATGVDRGAPDARITGPQRATLAIAMRTLRGHADPHVVEMSKVIAGVVVELYGQLIDEPVLDSERVMNTIRSNQQHESIATANPSPPQCCNQPMSRRRIGGESTAGAAWSCATCGHYQGPWKAWSEMTEEERRVATVPLEAHQHLAIGDVVRLKSGGPLMTVAGCVREPEPDDDVSVYWHDTAGQMQQATLRAGALQHVHFTLRELTAAATEFERHSPSVPALTPLETPHAFDGSWPEIWGSKCRLWGLLPGAPRHTAPPSVGSVAVCERFAAERGVDLDASVRSPRTLFAVEWTTADGRTGLGSERSDVDYILARVARLRREAAGKGMTHTYRVVSVDDAVEFRFPEEDDPAR